jgi:hypothetical protein
MPFQAQFAGFSLKAAVPGTPDTDGKEAILKIQLVVESPDAEVVGLLARLAATGEDVRVELTQYQMAFA